MATVSQEFTVRLRFEKVSDVNEDHCHLDVFYEGHKEAFMDVSVGPDKKPLFNLYGRNGVMSLSPEEWRAILAKADGFVKAEVENANSFRKLF